ncbi:probable tRNA(His) guanylyltransferase [Chrysoperla carnea]|uniref:probable tRNA(His) guanylyltransferase n=1 Tax=Chrysoperla carnea TaxID=189513 RepID=UPI001D0802AA|nr:probable tRNA(His) guanylyltransferase [Chrysoperla carnea]
MTIRKFQTKANFLIKRFFNTSKMANSKFEYVREFENEDKIMPNCWVVVRIDGKGFHKFSKLHNFDKPNDVRALELMNYAAIDVMNEFRDIVISFGQSDEYSFVFHKGALLYNRRHSKILTYVNSLFSSSYVFNWSQFFPSEKLQYPPSFDARIILYPSDENLKDYLSWRQADVHINNLYNTTFWNLILKGGLTNNEAEKRLSGTLSSDKNEILFSEFGINYNNESPMFRKGTILLRKKVKNPNNNGRYNCVIYPFFEDLIQNKFWKTHTEIFDYKSAVPTYDPTEKLPDIVEQQLRELDRKSQKT